MTHMLGAVWKSALIKNTAIMTRINKIYTVNSPSLSISLCFKENHNPKHSSRSDLMQSLRGRQLSVTIDHIPIGAASSNVNI